MTRALVFLLVLASALALPDRAWSQSGTYQLDPTLQTNPSGGTYVRGGKVLDDYTDSQGYGGSSGATYPGPVACTGTMTFSFVWEPSVLGDSAPLDVVVCVTSSATASGVSGVNATDGLGDTPVTTTNGGVTTLTSSGTHYYARGGQNTISVPVDPESSGTGGYVNGMGTLPSATARVTVTVKPVNISIWGALAPPAGGR